MISFLAEHMATESATNCTQQSSIGFRHGRSVRIVVGGVRIGRLWLKLVLARVRMRAGLLCAASLGQLCLVGLVLSIGVVATAIILLVGLWLSVVAWMTLWVARIVCAKLSTSLAVLKATMLGRPKGVLAMRRAKALILRRILL